MCGIFGIEGHADAANFTYLGLYALQHRGQESFRDRDVPTATDFIASGAAWVTMAEVFNEETVARRSAGHCNAVGHVPATRQPERASNANAQPFLLVSTIDGPDRHLVHNGNLVNAGSDTPASWRRSGSIFQTTSDTEDDPAPGGTRNPVGGTWWTRWSIALRRVRGAYSLVAMVTAAGMIAARDPLGFRPLVDRANWTVRGCSRFGDLRLRLAGRRRTCRDARARGEIIVVDVGGKLETPSSRSSRPSGRRRAFSSTGLFLTPRQSSCSANRCRRPCANALGERALSREAPRRRSTSSRRFPTPEFHAAIGYARASGVPFEMGLVRNHYVGRTFIEPSQSDSAISACKHQAQPGARQILARTAVSC